MEEGDEAGGELVGTEGVQDHGVVVEIGPGLDGEVGEAAVPSLQGGHRIEAGGLAEESALNDEQVRRAVQADRLGVVQLSGVGLDGGGGDAGP